MAGGDSAKADQIAFHIYTKVFHVLYAARASDQGPPSGKTDKWFNLATPLATPTAELDAYRALSAFSTSASQSPSTSSPSLPIASDSSSTGPPPPLAIQVLLAVPPPGAGATLVHTASSTRVEPEPRFVLLEERVLAFSPTVPTSSATIEKVLPPTIYKNAIPLFRALYALLRILPAWR
ncbi:phosphorylated protein that interacts with Vac8p, partial [Mycena crocata]